MTLQDLVSIWIPKNARVSGDLQQGANIMPSGAFQFIEAIKTYLLNFPVPSSTQYKDEGSNVGTTGNGANVNFVGEGVNVSAVGPDTIQVNVPQLLPSTTSASGFAGVAPAPPADSQNKFLRGDATYTASIPPFTSAVNYELGDVIYNPSDNKVYRCTTAHLSTGTFSSPNWTELSPSIGGAGNTDLSVTGVQQEQLTIASSTGNDATVTKAAPSDSSGIGGTSGLLSAEGARHLEDAITAIDLVTPDGAAVSFSVGQTGASSPYRSKTITPQYSGGGAFKGLLGTLGTTEGTTNDIGLLSSANVTKIVDLFTTSLKGAVPASGGGTTNFLRADGTWSAPPGLGTTFQEYSVSTGTASTLRVIATALGATCSYSAGVFTLTLPASSYLISADLLLQAGDVVATADAGGSTNWIRFKIANTQGNTSISNMRIPNVTKLAIPTSGALALNNAASVDIDNNPAVSITEVASNSITTRVSGLAVGAQGYILKFSNV